MKTINITEKDYHKLLLLLKTYQEVYGIEGETIWSFADLNDLQEVGTQIVKLLIAHLEKDYAQIVLDSK
jgi:hypothetical protein